MLCCEKTRLLDAYMDAVDQHGALVHSLRDLTGSDFEKAKAELVLHDANDERLAYEHHRETHGC